MHVDDRPDQCVHSVPYDRGQEASNLSLLEVSQSVNVPKVKMEKLLDVCSSQAYISAIAHVVAGCLLLLCCIFA